MRRAITLACAAIVLAASPTVANASDYYRTGALGVDVSYPNCTTALPSGFGVVGVTNGVVQSKNPCLAAEASHFADLSLYMNTGLNTSRSSGFYSRALAACHGDTSCAAYKYGYAAATSALAYARSQHVASTRWWLDVENGNTWSKDVQLNRRSLQGSYDALKAAGATMVGVYSTTAQWGEITGGWKNNWPSWGATVLTSAARAATYCTGHRFTGGPSLLIQYVDRRSRLDRNVAC
ncbi:hypothetical protein GA0111570_102265 [Raineyella antarctica]|uniref:Secreted protein n=1 Tax=Raineyella antarctica TaxID=1577474 RepID=A0A1G6GFF2_9ACTN|nr:hypothetical protein [Raineyella antarctica]SDB80475.1 hypothetical protein GA0111570_102265 [Raineyella antarctica]